MKVNINPVSKNAQEMYNEFRYGDFNYDREKHATFLKQLLKKIPKGAKVFDIGCGTGYWLDLYLRSGISKKNIVAIDLAPNNISELKKHGFNALIGDILHLPLKKEVSDITICDGVLHHCANPHQGFKELIRITKKGGLIYLNVYNKWNPYFYIVHKATFPIRYIYWNWNRKIVDIIIPFVNLILQPVSIFMVGKFLDHRTVKVLLLDQVMTPYAHLFSKKKMSKYAKEEKCEVIEARYNRYYLMIGSVIKKL